MNYEEAIKSAYQHHKVTDMSDIINALHYAKKEHELLRLYREYYGHIPYSDNTRVKYCEQKIDELEDKLEEEIK